MVKNERDKDNIPSHSLIDIYYNQMTLIYEKTGIPGTYVVLSLLMSVVFVYFNFLERMITNLVGTLYPAFWTMKSIENKSEDNKDWLTYWIVFAFFSIIDIFSGSILKFIPFYFFIKIIFLIWLFTGGAHYVYHFLVIRVYKSVEKNIDNATDKFSEYTKEIINKGKDYIDTGVNMASGKVLANFIGINSNEIINSEKKLESAENKNYSNTNNNSINNLLNEKKRDNSYIKTENKLNNNSEKIDKDQSEKSQGTAKNFKVSVNKIETKRELKKNKK